MRYVGGIKILAPVFILCAGLLVSPRGEAHSSVPWKNQKLIEKFCKHPHFRNHKFCPKPKPIEEECRPTEEYSASYTAYRSKPWPFHGGRCDRNSFRQFHSSHFGNWARGTYYFTGLDIETLKHLQLTRQTIVMKVLVERPSDLEKKNLKLSLNGFVGNATHADAITFKTLSQVQVMGSVSSKQLRKEWGDHFKRGYLVEVSFNLEKFLFRVNSSAADIIRLSPHLSFKVIPTRFALKSADVKLHLEGTRPGSCNPPPVGQPPVVQITSTSVGSITNQNSIAIGFQSDVPAQFQCSLDGANFQSCVSPSIYSNLADGNHQFSVVGINEHGTGAPAHYNWTVDTTAPVVNITAVDPSAPLTAMNQISIQFAANEPASFQCSLDSGVAAPCSSPFTASGLSDGAHTFRVLATDLAGNGGPERSYSWTVKLAPPGVQITNIVPRNNPTNVNMRTYEFSGTTDAASFVCSLDSQTAVPCSSPYSVLGLTDGSHLFAVRAIDSVGNLSAPATESFTVDTEAPNVQITSAIPSQSPTPTNSMELRFAADESANFRCSLDGLASIDCVSPVSFGALNDGPHRFEIVATDPAGNASSAASYSWVVDSIAPVLTITSVEPAGAVISQGLITLNFSVSEPSSITCEKSGVSQDCSSGSVSYASLIEGDHVVHLTPRDSAGNLGLTVSYYFRVDTTSPVVQITSTDPSVSPTNSSSMVLNFQANESAQFRCQIDGGAFSPCASPMSYSALSDGTHIFVVVGVDSAGNVSASPATHTWTVDATAPSVQITSREPSANLTNQSGMTVYFQASEASQFQCQLDSLNWTACTSPAVFNGLADGAHTFRVFAIDLANNRSSTTASATWTVDTLAPVTQITSTSIAESPTEATDISFSFSANEAATFECRIDGGSVTPCMSPMSYAGLSPGSHVVEVFATDLAGNRDATGARYSWDIISVPLVLSNVQITGITRTTVTISWTSNKPATSQVAFATSLGVYSYSPASSSLTTNHSVTLTGLAPNTFYTVYGISVSGSQTVNTNTGSFRTLR